MYKLMCKIFHVGYVSFVLEKIAGWATSLSAGEADWTSEFSFFKVVIELTDAGHGSVLFFSQIFILYSEKLEIVLHIFFKVFVH